MDTSSACKTVVDIEEHVHRAGQPDTLSDGQDNKRTPRRRKKTVWYMRFCFVCLVGVVLCSVLYSDILLIYLLKIYITL